MLTFPKALICRSYVSIFLTYIRSPLHLLPTIGEPVVNLQRRHTLKLWQLTAWRLKQTKHTKQLNVQILRILFCNSRRCLHILFLCLQAGYVVNMIVQNVLQLPLLPLWTEASNSYHPTVGTGSSGSPVDPSVDL